MLYTVNICGTKTFIDRPSRVSWIEGQGGWIVHSTALICPKCLKVWATLTFQGDTHHEIQAASCALCNHLWNVPGTPHRSVPGSILVNDLSNGTDWGLLECLPVDLLRQEFFLHLNAYQESDNGQAQETRVETSQEDLLKYLTKPEDLWNVL